MAINPKDLLGPPITSQYTATGWLYPSFFMYFNKRKPPFSLANIPMMLMNSRIRLGLWLIKGPLVSEAKFYVKCDDETVRTFVRENINKFWRCSVIKAFSGIEWGFSGSEVLYELKNGMIYFDDIKLINQFDSRVITSRGRKVGMVVRNNETEGKLYIGGPKSFWYVHGREVNANYGVSRLVASFAPWIELITDGGAYDVRHLYFHKYAYSGDTIYYPPGISQLPGGQEVSNKDLAREIVEKRRTGGVTALPNVTDEQGNKRWEVLPGQVNPGPVNVSDYIETLKREMLEGMGIPPEVVVAEGTGAYAGRLIPERAFYCQLQEILTGMIDDFDTQILKPITKMGFGNNHAPYEIIPASLVDAVTGQNMDNPDQGPEDTSAAPDVLPGDNVKIPGQEDIESVPDRAIAPLRPVQRRKLNRQGSQSLKQYARAGRKTQRSEQGTKNIQRKTINTKPK